MGLSGAAFGAGKALEDIIGEQMMRARMAQQQQEAAARMKLDEQRLNESIRQNDLDEKFRGRQEDRVLAGDRQKTNEREVRRMIGEGITRRVPLDDMQGIAFAEGIDLPQAPTPKMRSVTTMGPNGRPINRMVPESESVEEYREPPAPQRPERDPIADREAILKLEQKYKTSNNGAGPAAEAADTAREAKRIASSLLGSKGLDGAFGVINARLPTLKQDTADAEVLRDALTSLLTLENTGKLKGVLSNADMAILRQASTTIAGPMSPEAARTELKRIVEVMGRAAGEGPTGQMPKMDMATSRGTVAAPATVAQSPYEQYLARKRGGG